MEWGGGAIVEGAGSGPCTPCLGEDAQGREHSLPLLLLLTAVGLWVALRWEPQQLRANVGPM